MKMMKNSGVKKSANDVINGIKKLLGSFPCLNNIIELMNNDTNIIKNINKTVSSRMKIIRKGLKILIPVVIAIV
jgi:hypothetical protein